MLRLYDRKHDFVGFIYDYKDEKIVQTLSTGDKELSFTIIADQCDAEVEGYIQTEDDEYVIKDIDIIPGEIDIDCDLNLEGLESKIWKTFEVTDITLAEAAQMAMDGTDWTLGECKVDKVRSAGCQMSTALDVINDLCTAWMCERVYDTFKKTVSFYEKIGEDKGVYFLHGLNLKKMEVTTTSQDYYTQIFPYGKDDLTIESVNDGKLYLENYQYSNKIRPCIWEDTFYEDAETLMEDAKAHLDDLSKPAVSYKMDIVDLASQSHQYEILSYSIGDTVTVADTNSGIMDKQRIVKMTTYPANPEKNEAELANTVPTFEELHSQLKDAADIINNITSSDGTVNGYYVHGVQADGITGLELEIENSDIVQEIIRRLEALGG